MLITYYKKRMICASSVGRGTGVASLHTTICATHVNDVLLFIFLYFYGLLDHVFGGLVGWFPNPYEEGNVKEIVAFRSVIATQSSSLVLAVARSYNSIYQ